ncbi:MAG: hypothetical protein QNJ81_14900 [Acidimicrobiia bacterium]|nr:hypothetical protein [Acidimicrobiia bacterium]
MSWTYLKAIGSDICDDEAGAVESAQIFAWIVVTVIAIMALGAMMQALGVDVINWVRAQIGI